MKKLSMFLMPLLAAILIGLPAYAQVTTSSLEGIVTDDKGETLVGAVIVAVHNPSGTQYYASSNEKGQYRIYGMRAGGPYTVSISFLGTQTAKYEEVSLKLGEAYIIDAKLASSNELDAVMVTAEKGYNASITGAGSSFSTQQIENTPMIDRSVYDVAKLNPMVSSHKEGGITIAGANNRYNAFTVDGADAKDSFGLTATGTNGGQTGANPISMDAIEELQVSIAPFDVRQSGFTGGALNAVTKSGTNKVKGSAYGYFFNQDLIGTTPGNEQQMLDNFNATERTKYTNELYQTYGATVGAPIVKDKLFIFASFEYFSKSYPNIYTPANGSYDNKGLTVPVQYEGKTYTNFNSELAQIVADYYQKTYAPQGDYSESIDPHQVKSRSINALARIDWNINDNNKLMVRYQFMDAYADKYGSGASTYYYNNSSYKQSARTHTIVAELNSRFSDTVHNELRASAVLERDKRTITYQGANIYFKGEKPVIDLGTDYSSGGNSMDSDTYTLTDNVTIFAGDHTITAGTDNKFYRFNNLFLQYAYGGYTFNSISDYLSNLPTEFNFKYIDPQYTGGNTLWAATTNILQLGFYAQDEWKPSRNFTLTYGVRIDMPMYLNKPTENPEYNATDYAKNNNEYVGVVPKTQVLWSPRVGFRWFLNENHSSLLRGGVGVFTGQCPFVWISNAYNNTGMEQKSVTVKNPTQVEGFVFTSDPYNKLIKTGVFSASGSGATINTLNENFKNPQVLRANIGFDQEFGEGWKFSFDGLYTKGINNVYFKNLAIQQTGKVYAVPGVEASASPYYTTISGNYSAIVALQNTSKGYSYSLSGKLEKHFNFGLDLMAGYTFGHSYSVNDGSSSVAYSNWKYNYSVDTNGEELGYSWFDRPHRVIAVASYNSPKYAGRRLSTNVALTYEGQSGTRYAHTMSENADFNGDGQTGNSLMYVPTTEEIGLMNWTSAEDAQKFENYIRGDKYLSAKRGSYVGRYEGVAPFENHFDLHLGEAFYYDKARSRKIELSVDIKNLSNMFNRAWGLYYASDYNVMPLKVNSLSDDGNGNKVATYSWYDDTTVKLSDFYSRWRMQIGLKITF